MKSFCHLLLFFAFTTPVNLAPTTLAPQHMESIIEQTYTLSKNMTPDPGEEGREIKIVAEEFNREETKCLQTYLRTFIDGLTKKDQPIIKNLEIIAAHFNASCPSIDETSCDFNTTNYEGFKKQLSQFLDEIPSDCQNLKPAPSKS